MWDLLRHKTNKTEDPNLHHKALLTNYGFTNLDEFDAVILEGVERGFFDETTIKRKADELQLQLQRGDKNNSFAQAWRRLHNSFDNDEDAVLDEIAASAKTNCDAITAVDLSAAVSFLKEFGREAQAKEVLQFFIDTRVESADFWNLASYPLAFPVNDPDVVAAFSQKFSTMTITPDLGQILIGIGKRDGRSEGNLAFLASRTAAEYVDIFKRLRGDELRFAVNGALYFRDVGSADERLKTITRIAEEALRQIAAESSLNAKRVMNYGVKIDEPATISATLNGGAP
jgi:hypothetical protein